MVRNGKLNKKQLRVRRVVDVPLREVSGICLRRSRNGRSSLIAVGDRAGDSLVFPAAQRWEPDRLAYQQYCEALRFYAAEA